MESEGSYASYSECDIESDAYKTLQGSNSSSSSSSSLSLSNSRKTEDPYCAPDADIESGYDFASYLGYGGSDEGLYRSYHSDEPVDDLPSLRRPLPRSSLDRPQDSGASLGDSSRSEASLAARTETRKKKKKNRTFTDFFRLMQNQKTEELLTHHNTGAKSSHSSAASDSLWVLSSSDSEDDDDDQDFRFSEDLPTTRNWNNEFQSLMEMSDKYEKVCGTFISFLLSSDLHGSSSSSHL